MNGTAIDTGAIANILTANDRGLITDSEALLMIRREMSA